MRATIIALALAGCSSSLGVPRVVDGVPTCFDGEVATDAVPACGTTVVIADGSCSTPLAGISGGAVVCPDGATPFCGLPPVRGDRLDRGFCPGDWLSECAALGGDCVREWDPVTGTLGPMMAR